MCDEFNVLEAIRLLNGTSFPKDNERVLIQYTFKNSFYDAQMSKLIMGTYKEMHDNLVSMMESDKLYVIRVYTCKDCMVQKGRKHTIWLDSRTNILMFTLDPIRYPLARHLHRLPLKK
jgi:hypothetical protein